MAKLFICIGEFEKIPLSYGLAYRNYASMKAIYCPIPLNLIVRWCREIYFILMRGLCKTKTEKMLEKAVRIGLDKGYRAGLYKPMCHNDKIELLQELIPVFKELLFCKVLTAEQESRFVDNAVLIVTKWLEKKGDQ